MRATNTHTYIIHGSTNERQLRQARVTTDKDAPLLARLLFLVLQFENVGGGGDGGDGDAHASL